MGELMTSKELIEEMVSVVRDKARTLPNMKKANGNIRISITPLTKEANDFFGGLGKFNRKTTIGPACVSVPDDIVRQEAVYELFPEKPHGTSNPGSTKTSHSVIVTVLKKVQMNVDESIGRVLQFVDWVRIEIGVFGTKKTDEEYTCASVATWVVQKFFKELDSENFSIKGPEYKV